MNIPITEDPAADAPDAHTAPDWLLVGKLAPPEQRISVASRQELIARLDENLSRTLSVIISPPGFGKTTLLTQWWRALGGRQGLHACWLTVDDLDSEVSRFVAGMILSVARACSSARSDGDTLGPTTCEDCSSDSARSPASRFMTRPRARKADT